MWVCWPKKSSPLFKDLTEDGIRDVVFANGLVDVADGLVDVKACAVDADWSGLKLMERQHSPNATTWVWYSGRSLGRLSGSAVRRGRSRASIAVASGKHPRPCVLQRSPVRFRHCPATVMCLWHESGRLKAVGAKQRPRRKDKLEAGTPPQLESPSQRRFE